MPSNLYANVDLFHQSIRVTTKLFFMICKLFSFNFFNILSLILEVCELKYVPSAIYEQNTELTLSKSIFLKILQILQFFLIICYIPAKPKKKIHIFLLFLLFLFLIIFHFF